MNSTTTRISLLTLLSFILLTSCSDDLRLDKSFVHFAYDYSPQPGLNLLDASANVDITSVNVKTMHSPEKVDFCIEGIRFESGEQISIESLSHCPLIDCEDELPIINVNGAEVQAKLNDNLSIIIHTTESLTEDYWNTLESAVEAYSNSAPNGKLNLYTTNLTLSSPEGQDFQAYTARIENVNLITPENEAENLNDLVEFSIRSNSLVDIMNNDVLSSLIIVTNEIDTREIDYHISNYLSTYLLRIVDEQHSVLDYTAANVNRELYNQSYIATDNEGFEESLEAFKQAFFSNQRVVFSLEGQQILEQTTIKINLGE